MNDRIILGFFLYLVIASFTIGLMPDELFSGSVATDLDQDELRAELNEAPTGFWDNMGYIYKVGSFMFIPITITGIPALLGLILTLFHFVIFVMTGIYITKLVRGVS